MSGKKKEIQKSVSIRNRKASHEYHFIDIYQAGIVLQGTEIKSIRMGKVTISDAFCLFIGNELFLRNLHIAQYDMGNIHNHEEKADRKLLLKRKELKKLQYDAQDVGLTIIPTKVYVNDRGLAKIEVVLAKGKKLYDKRQDLKAKDAKRELDRF
ncbi:SsrA-binding protein [Bernardetia litoralis DSM 6794]|uniref:SsrA-binding protein n=1 Tax=Bernardetia litoralis (strain ATCC 23117 / DSM 6794 / NBRC 15988 / NCIMB 1366 / Fx l1 / Sio-4) TaxID=880071 RepID=I4AL02_BERLS|nr:SsrA-binding protein SmpB [Bernardetia litoralis]AFM04637.1 SsrA-binding protein [Bernardetia litoralis DSM 6794]